MPNHLLSKLAVLQTFIVSAVVVASLLAVPARAGLGNELFKLTTSDGATGDQFGRSVAVSGNVAIIGADGDDHAGDSSGSAYLFNVMTGGQLSKLTASDAAANHAFGFSV